MAHTQKPNNLNDASSIRLFESDFLESLTHVHPIIPLVMWAPVVGYCLYDGISIKGLTLAGHVFVAVCALLIWTLAEYAIHRWAFHFESDSKFITRIIFLFHGIHHDDPQDATRLVMPPFPAVILVSILYFTFKLIIPAPYMLTFMGWFLIGYLCYDYIHYATHHFPMTSKVGRYLRKYHLQHHFANEESKYGVSNPLWDYIFNTVDGPKKS
jgi:sterol desaturase/sphingolipid hydroxylase (fatty acid hydroxylase superfamily)